MYAGQLGPLTMQLPTRKGSKAAETPHIIPDAASLGTSISDAFQFVHFQMKATLTVSCMIAQIIFIR